MAENYLAEQRADLARKAWDLRLEGWTCRQIAEELGCHYSTVSRWLAHYRRQAHEELSEEAKYLLADEVEIAQGLVRKAIEGWERSCRPAEEVKFKGEMVGGVPMNGEVTITRRGQAGDPRFIMAALAALQRITERIGYYVPDVDGDEVGKAVDPDDLRREMERLRIIRGDGSVADAGPVPGADEPAA